MTATARLNRPALGVALAFAVTQDILYALIFLSFMNHYLLDVLDASPGLPGYTLALYGGTRLVIHPIAGRLLDLTRPRVVYLASLIVQLVALIGLALFQSLPLFLAATVLLAIGSAAMWPLTYSLVAATQPSGQRSRIGGMLAIAGYAAMGAGLALGVLLAEVAGSRPAFVAAAIVVCLPAVAISGRTLGGRNVHSDREASSGERGGWRGLVLFASILFVNYAAIAGIAGIYGPYSRRTLDLSLLQTTFLLLPTGVAAAASLAIVSKYSRPGRRFQELMVLYALAATGAFALSLTDTPATAAALAVVLGLGAGGTAPVVAAIMLDAGSGRAGGTIIGSLMSVEGLGSVAGPAAVALATDLHGPRAGLAVIAALFALLTPLSFIASRRGGVETAAASSL